MRHRLGVAICYLPSPCKRGGAYKRELVHQGTICGRKVWIAAVQQMVFPDEIATLGKGGELSKGLSALEPVSIHIDLTPLRSVRFKWMCTVHPLRSRPHYGTSSFLKWTTVLVFHVISWTPSNEIQLDTLVWLLLMFFVRLRARSQRYKTQPSESSSKQMIDEAGLNAKNERGLNKRKGCECTFLLS